VPLPDPVASKTRCELCSGKKAIDFIQQTQCVFGALIDRHGLTVTTSSGFWGDCVRAERKGRGFEVNWSGGRDGYLNLFFNVRRGWLGLRTQTVPLVRLAVEGGLLPPDVSFDAYVEEQAVERVAELAPYFLPLLDRLLSGEDDFEKAVRDVLVNPPPS
jgi:hypothetical protein